MSLLKPSNDTLITMARLVYEQSELNFLNVSFSIRSARDDMQTLIIVNEHDDTSGTYKIHSTVTVSELVASYIGLTLKLDLPKNDEVTKGHRLGRNR